MVAFLLPPVCSSLSHGGFSLFFLSSYGSKPGNLNPTYVSSSQLSAAGIFSYQSELTVAGSLSVFRVDSLIFRANSFGGAS